MSGNLLTREEYEVVVKKFCETLGAEILRRWDESAERYGACLLDSKDYEKEIRDEAIDWVSWSLIECVKKERCGQASGDVLDASLEGWARRV